MNDDSKWKRKHPGRIYDYNYKVSAGYYQPQSDYIDTKAYNLSFPLERPEHQSYAERFSSKPWYGTTRGLPYNETEAAMYQPLVNRRAVSASRASSIMRERAENPGIPQSVRAAQRRRESEQKMAEAESVIVKPMRKVTLEDTTEVSHKKINVKEELRKLDEVKFPSTITRRATVHKSSYTETSSKPPTGARRRYISFTSDDSSPVTPPFIPKSRELRKLQRGAESESLTEHIHKMVSKMRSHDIDPEEAYKYTKSIRASSLDPFGNDNKYQARHRAVRATNFIYGVGN